MKHRYAGTLIAPFAAAMPLFTSPCAASPVSALGDPTNPNKYALVIGVSDYDNWPLTKSNVKDAVDFAELLKTKYGFPSQNIVLLTDSPDTPRSRPTLRHIVAALNTLYGAIVPGKSDIVFFFSGYGANTSDTQGFSTDWLAPEDGDPAMFSTTCVSYGDIRRNIDYRAPLHALLVTDVCGDAKVDESVGATGFGKELSFGNLGTQISEIESCRPDESSLKDETRGATGSAFVTSLINGLSGNDVSAATPDRSAVTFDSLKRYVQASVQQIAAKRNAKQTPDGRSGEGGVVYVSLGGNPAPPGPVVTNAVAIVAPTPTLLPLNPPPPPTPAPSVAAVPSKNRADGAELCYVPAGEFVMGANDLGAAFAEHKVNLGAYWIYKTPVTVAQYRRFCRKTNRRMPAEPAWGWRDSDPVVNVSWQDASDYASYVNAALPTEAQWEKAARGTDGRQYPWGDTWQPERCVSALQTGQHTMPVGSFPTNASPYGCVDMAGNVWQWCADVFDSKYYSVSPAENPTGPASGSNHVLRGGGWVDVKPKTFRSAYRYYDGEDNYDDSYGFRCVIPAP